VNIEDYYNYCLSLKGSKEHMPFDEKTLVFKIKNKIYTLTNIENFKFINLKCNPEKALELRERYHSVKPGYHMNKKHWNSIYIKGNDINNNLIKKWILDSYNLVSK
jgi:predicted DNA-binding protein (MmcQ/YjbR family)